MQQTGPTTGVRPIFATTNPLLISAVREILVAAGIPADPDVVAPDGLSEFLTHAGGRLVFLDGQTLPYRDHLAHLCRTHPDTQFVVWTTRPTAELLRIALECGVHGLLSTRLPVEEAAHALLGIGRGDRILRFDPDPASLSAKPRQFTPRERNVLLALSRGASNPAIAADLQTTASTIKGCLSRLFRKTGARNRRELAQLGHSILRSVEPPRDETDEPTFDETWMLKNL